MAISGFKAGEKSDGLEIGSSHGMGFQDRVGAVLLGLSYVAACLFCSTDSMSGAGYTLLFLAFGAIGLFRNKLPFSLTTSLSLIWVVVLSSGLLVLAVISPVEKFAVADMILIISGVLCLFIAGKLSLYSSCYKWIVAFFVVALFGHLFVAFIHIGIDGKWLPFYRLRENLSHVSGLYLHRNYLGNLIASFACMFFAGSVFIPRSLWKYVLMGLSVLSFCFVIWSASRGAIFAMGVGLLSIVAFYIYSNWLDELISLRRVSLLLGTASICGIIGVAGYYWSVDKRDLSSGGTFHGRESFFKVAIEQIIDKPLLGGGARSFSWRSIEFWPEGLWKGAPHMNYVHNEYLQMIVDYGLLVGGVTLLSLVIFLCISVYRFSSLSVEYRALYTGAFGVVVVFMAQSCVSFPLHVLPNFMCFMICLGVLLSSSLGVKSKVHYVTSVGLSVFVIFALVLAWGRIPRHMYQISRDKADKFGGDIVAAQQAFAESGNEYDDYTRLGDLLFTEALNEPVAFSESMNSAKMAYQKAYELHPFHLKAQVALGVCYDYLGDFEKADEMLLKAAKTGDVRESYLQIHRRLAQHYFAWGLAHYNDRGPNEALFYFNLSRVHLLKTKKLWAAPDPKWNEEKRDVEEYIEFLERAGVEAVSPD